MYKTLVTLFILFASPLIVGASVPTDVGNTLIQRTPYDTYSKYAKWCTTDSYGASVILTDENGLPYWSKRQNEQFNFDHDNSCDNLSDYYQNIPYQSFMPDIEDGARFYVIYGNGTEKAYDTGTTTSTSLYSGWTMWNSDNITCNNDCPAPYHDHTTVAKSLPYSGVSYYIAKLGFVHSSPTTTLTNPVNNAAVPRYVDFDIFSTATTSIYAIVYTSTDIYNEIVTPQDLFDYLEYLNTGIYNPNTPTTPTSVATNTIYQIQSPAYASVYSLGSRSTTTVRFQYTYGIADTTYDYASIELYNLTSGITYNTPQQPIVMSGLNTYTTYLTLPAGNYTWRPYLHATSSNLYQNNGSWFTFTIAGNTTEWWGSYSVATDTLATSTTWFDTTWGTSTFTLGTTTYDFSDINLDLLDFGSGVCGVNMSCFIPFCIDFPNLCNRFPFAYAVDIFSILNVWSGIFQTGVEIDQVTFDYDSGYGTGTITMLDLSEGTIARQLADKVRYFSSLIVWLSFGFWAFALTGKILS